MLRLFVVCLFVCSSCGTEQSLTGGLLNLFFFLGRHLNAPTWSAGKHNQPPTRTAASSIAPAACGQFGWHGSVEVCRRIICAAGLPSNQPVTSACSDTLPLMRSGKVAVEPR